MAATQIQKKKNQKKQIPIPKIQKKKPLPTKQKTKPAASTVLNGKGKTKSSPLNNKAASTKKKSDDKEMEKTEKEMEEKSSSDSSSSDSSSSDSSSDSSDSDSSSSSSSSNKNKTDQKTENTNEKKQNLDLSSSSDSESDQDDDQDKKETEKAIHQKPKNQNLAKVSSGDGKKEKKRIFIKNLNFRSTHKDLMDFMKEFEIDVDFVKILTKFDGSLLSKGCAIVVCSDEENARKLLKRDGQVLMDRALNISYALERGENNSEVKNGMKRKKVHRGGKAKSGIPSLDQKPVDCKTIFVGNLNFSTTGDSLKKFFSDCGQVRTVRIVHDRFTGKSRGFAYVDFEKTEAVNKTLEKASKVLDGRSIVINFAMKKEFGGGDDDKAKKELKGKSNESKKFKADEKD